MSINVLDLLLMNVEEKRTTVVRGGSLVCQSCEMTGLASGERFEKTSCRLRTLHLRRVDFSFFGELGGCYEGRRCPRQLANFFFKEKLFRAWEQTLPLHMKIRNFSTKPASLIKTLLSELRC